MNRSWMHADRRSYEYKLGVAEFCEFALRNARDSNRICCPCTNCGNVKDFSAKVIRDHLFVNGIDTGYEKWTEHGEVVVELGSDTDSESIDETESSESDTVQGNMGADYEVQLDSDVDLEGDEDEQLSSECNEFRKFVDDANKPLFPGCTRHTKMNVIVRLYNLKAKHGMSDAAYSDWLIAFSEYLPVGNDIPSSVYEAKKTLSALGMDYTKIHACPNDCILYRKQFSDDIVCPTCGLSRWKVCKNGQEKEGVPAKVLWYFPPIPRFKRMFQSIETSKNLICHAAERNKDGLIRHPADSASWKLVDEKWPAFGNEPRNLRLALSSDGFNPHSSLSSKYSCWPVILVTYNLPPWLVMKRKHMMLTLLISGPKQPGNDIDVYLEPLIDDLKLLREGVSGVYDAIRNETFTVKALLFWTINDFPAYGNLSGSIVKGYNACPICLDKTEPTRLVHGGKMAYTIHRRFLGRHHPYRKQRAAFNNRPEHSPAPVPLTGEELLRRLEEEVPQWHYGKKYPPPPYKGAEDQTRPCWKKKSIFFQLEYWKYLPVRHCLDVMHIEKNVCDSLIGTLLNIPGKTKDGLKTRLDLLELGIRLGLQPNLDGPKKKRLPLASWNLTVDEKKCMCGCFNGMKVPEDYSSNISSLVSMEDLRLTGLKSHDCHALMQQLLPVAIRGVLEKPVRVAVIRLCMFFNEIYSKTIDALRLPKIQSDLVETLCELEKYFPPSFFDIMIHLTVHLVREVELCGPVCFRWMFPFERYMKVCKGYVRNRRLPEGCIAECYIAEEAVEFLAELFFDDKTVGIPEAPITDDKPTSGATVMSVFGKDFDQAHLCVLQNTDEFRSYFVEHKEYLKREFPKYKKNEKWLVAFQLNEPGADIPEIVRWLADKPGNEVPKFSGYRIGGVQYNTKMRDDLRTTQSSGVYLVAKTPQVASAKDKNVVIEDMSFYGVIAEIWELDYDHFRVPIFKCDWVENEKGVRVDDLGFTLVNLNRKGHVKDTFVLGKCVEQVFYVQDPIDHRWSVVLSPPKKDYIDSVQVDDQLGETVISHPPIASTMPSIHSLDDLIDEEPVGYMRVGDEDILVDGE
ncbi:uncharacterized protein LOC133725417 [Rosa rugosa]|uniref:uncharacterized protein LOC133725417 n=1 Tax=Rosa rugosa TaxID=74645 RepID=UPI002B40A79B|nr:uncharacterized protein LOC133725417 [Rosa rugosa]